MKAFRAAALMTGSVLCFAGATDAQEAADSSFVIPPGSVVEETLTALALRRAVAPGEDSFIAGVARRDIGVFIQEQTGAAPDFSPEGLIFVFVEALAEPPEDDPYLDEVFGETTYYEPRIDYFDRGGVYLMKLWPYKDETLVMRERPTYSDFRVGARENFMAFCYGMPKHYDQCEMSLWADGKSASYILPLGDIGFADEINAYLEHKLGDWDSVLADAN